MSKRSHQLLLEDILESAYEIEKYTHLLAFIEFIVSDITIGAL